MENIHFSTKHLFRSIFNGADIGTSAASKFAFARKLANEKPDLTQKLSRRTKIIAALNRKS